MNDPLSKMIIAAGHLGYFNQHSNIEGLPFGIHVPGADPTDEERLTIIAGGIHGNETVGVKAAIELHQAIQAGRLRIRGGSLAFILGNPVAYAGQKRFTDYNLNRLFSPGRLERHGDSSEGKRAQQILQYMRGVQKKLSGMIDLHSVSSGDFTMPIINQNDATAAALLQRLDPSVFDMYFAYNTESLEGIFSQAGVKLGATSLAFECGNHDNPLAMEIALAAIRITLEQLGYTLEGTFEWPPFPQGNKTPLWYQTLPGGHGAIRPTERFYFVNPEISTGTTLTPGDVIARDPNGTVFHVPVIGDSEHGPLAAVMPSSRYRTPITMDDAPRQLDVDAVFICETLTVEEGLTQALRA